MLFTNKTVKKRSALIAYFCVYWFFSVNDVLAQNHIRTDTLPAFRDTLILSNMDSAKIKASKNNIAEEPISKKNKKISAGPGIGMMNFYGDIRSRNIGDPNSNRFAFAFDIKKEWKSNFDLGIRFLTGKLAGNEYSKEYRNFESKINQLSFNFIYSFFPLKKEEFKPYLFAGINTFFFKSYTDYIDENGNTYYYWSDGLIYDKDENDANAAKARLLKRDYVYETELSSNKAGGSGSAGIGLFAAITQNVDINFMASYNYTFSDKIDNFSDGLADQFAFTSIGFNYTISNKSQKVIQYQSPQDSAIIAFENTDSDHDGVIDFYDQCPNTPVTILVNKSGCPVDKDNDGIPDHRDEEKKTSKSVMVDLQGKEITKGVGIAMFEYRSSTDSALIRSVGDTTIKKPLGITQNIEMSSIHSSDTIVYKSLDVNNDSSAFQIIIAEPLQQKDTIDKLSISINDEINTIGSTDLITKKQDTLALQSNNLAKKDSASVTLKDSFTVLQTGNNIESTSQKDAQKQILISDTVTEIQVAKESPSNSIIKQIIVEPTDSIKKSTKIASIASETITTDKKVEEIKIIETQHPTEHIDDVNDIQTATKVDQQINDTMPNVFNDSLILAESDEQVPVNNVVEGIIFSINIGAFQNEIPGRFFKKLKLTPVLTEPGPGNSQYYIVGQFLNFKDAAMVKKDLKYIGFKDAEIVAYSNGEKITLKDAIEITNK